jgi:hypothetical protein
MKSKQKGLGTWLKVIEQLPGKHSPEFKPQYCQKTFFGL